MKLVFRAHAVQRMFERAVSVEDVKEVLAKGRLVEDYPDSFPYPSRLLLGFASGRALHIVAANNHRADEIIMVTVYPPDPALWAAGFLVRKS